MPNANFSYRFGPMRYAIIFALLTGFAFSVKAEPPSEASVNEMLKYLQVDRLLTQAVTQMNEGIVKAMDQKIQTTVGARQLNPEQTAAIDKFRTKFNKSVQDQLSLPKIRAIYLQCYRETFTQGDVSGVIAFYKSPAGQAISQKYPEVMQKSQTLMQARMGSLSESVGKDMDQLIKDLEKSEPKPAESATGATKPAKGSPAVDTGKNP